MEGSNQNGLPCHCPIYLDFVFPAPHMAMLITPMRISAPYETEVWLRGILSCGARLFCARANLLSGRALAA